jgi:malate synthase
MVMTLSIYFSKIIIFILRFKLIRSHSVGETDLAGIKGYLYRVCCNHNTRIAKIQLLLLMVRDKALVYRNWLGLMKGDLSDTFMKNGSSLTRKLNP